MKQRHTAVWSAADGRHGGKEHEARCTATRARPRYRTVVHAGGRSVALENARATAILRLPCKTGIPSHETRPHSHATSV